MKTFWRSHDLALTDCEIKVDLLWLRKRVIPEISRTAAVAANPPNLARDETKTYSTIFQIISAKLYVQIITLSINDNIKRA